MRSKMGKWGIKKNKAESKRGYARLLPGLRRVARRHGYALGLHGSMRRDLDLIAVPWREKFSPPEKLARALQRYCCGLYQAKYNFTDKPNGRKATIIVIGWNSHIDLSVVPYIPSSSNR